MSIFHFLSSSLLFCKRFLSLFFCWTCYYLTIELTFLTNLRLQSEGHWLKWAGHSFAYYFILTFGCIRRKIKKFSTKHGELSSAASVFQTFFCGETYVSYKWKCWTEMTNKRKTGIQHVCMYTDQLLKFVSVFSKLKLSNLRISSFEHFPSVSPQNNNSFLKQKQFVTLNSYWQSFEYFVGNWYIGIFKRNI